MQLMNGLLIVDKPPGVTSHDVVGRVRHILRERRVGHTGTLDPFATGVLVILIGCATRLAQFLTGVEKEYEAVIRIGYATDTGDATGARITDLPLPGEGRKWTVDEIETAMQGLRGDIDQVPPMYSAKKRQGRKLYELARRGEEVVRQPLRVSIHRFEALAGAGDILKDNLDGTFDLEVRVECSAGTYVRTLAEDFGKRLGVGAHLAELRRTRVADFRIEEATTLDQLTVKAADEALGTILRAPDEALLRFPSVDLSVDELRRAVKGLDIDITNPDWPDEQYVRMRDADGNLVAVGQFNRTKSSLHPGVVIAL
jgi:tRNA pseudouridine55 synthase